MNDDELWFEQSGDELRDDEYPEEDSYEDDFSETVPCPHCGTDVYEDAVRCPVCENYITRAGPAASWANRPWWWIILGLLGTLAAILVLAGLVR